MSEITLANEAYQKVLQLVREPINVYIFGSRLYKCHAATADFDMVVITPDLTFEVGYTSGIEANLSLYSIADFKQKIAEHDIVALECLFAPHDKILKRDMDFDFKLDLSKLRKSLSAKASHSWVKAKKKFDVEHDVYIAKKSLFHSLRILIFGKQIAEYGSIVDFTAANHFWQEIMDNPATDWKTYKQMYKPIFNNLSTLFKKAAPK